MTNPYPYLVFQIVQPLDLVSCHMNTDKGIKTAHQKNVSHQNANALVTSYWINEQRTEI
jgi:hypothetical protein